MAEWLKAAVLKTARPARVSGVRIPLPPPYSDDAKHRCTAEQCDRWCVPTLLAERIIEPTAGGHAAWNRAQSLYDDGPALTESSLVIAQSGGARGLRPLQTNGLLAH